MDADDLPHIQSGDFPWQTVRSEQDNTFDVAMENGPFESDLPVQKLWSSIVMLIFQRVHIHIQ